jgi:hypothetical protein
MQNNWDLLLTIRIEADDADSIIELLNQVAEYIKLGHDDGQGNFCLGTYEYEVKQKQKGAIIRSNRPDYGNGS